MVYGEGLPAGFTLGGQTWDFLAGGLDIVAHELSHGVTEFTSNLIYRNESGALNESFSDMMGTSAEFFFQPAGSGNLKADYLIGEDVIRPGGIRSMENPGLFGDPDHYSKRFQGTDDNGGVHINSGIPNQVFYLAIEGGTNRTSGLSVEGVGGANREQIEKVFYRAFTQLMPSNATFSVARAVSIQSARDLYGSGSPAERAVTQAWTAVGVQ
jgi:thermolysin